MKALLAVIAFWLFVAVIVGWALGLAASIYAELWALVGVLIVVPVAALSTFLWFVFQEVLCDL